MSITKLVKGQRVQLPKLTQSDTIHLQIYISGLRRRVGFYCLGLNKNDKLLKPAYLIHPERSQSPCQSITLQSQEATRVAYTITLSKIPSDLKGIDFVLSIAEDTDTLEETSADIQEGHLMISDGNNNEVARYTFSAQDFEGEKALVLSKVYYKKVWRMALAGAGYRVGLRALLPQYDIAPDTIQLRGQPSQSTSPTPPDRSTPSAQSQRAEAVGLPVHMPPHWPGEQSPTIPKDLIKTVGLILVENKDGTRASGTGFVINPGGYLLTCYHVVEQARKIDICMNETNYLRPIQYVAGSAEQDAALLWIADGNGMPYWIPLADPNEEPDLGLDLGLLGYPLGLDLGLNASYSQGIINSHRQRGNRPLLQIDAGAASGSSGGPVFRRSDGRVMGILQGGFEKHGMLINLAWDIRAFWQLGWHFR